MKALFPRVYSAYEEFTKYAVRLSRTETALLKGMLQSVEDPTEWSSEAESLYKRLTL